MTFRKFFGALIATAMTCAVAGAFTPAPAAQFTADIVISGSGRHYTYRLHVLDNRYRYQKVEGPEDAPPYPGIVDRERGVTWGLNPQTHQYVEMKELEETFMMNPLVGWAVTRKGLTAEEGPTEVVNGYECETRIYREAGKAEPAAKVWIAKKLNHLIREERFGTNENPVMELRNIQEGPVDPALLEIPEGYTKMDMGAAPGPKSADQAPKEAAAQPPAASAPEQAPGEAAAPASSGNIVFILDASGSMWGQVEGKAKIAIAKEVLTGLIKDLPDDATVGLVAYGHRRKGDCSDVEELVPLSPVDKKNLIKIIQSLKPKGKTPISRSVRLTAERLKHLEEETTLILVSDGKETCDPDPCALVKELKEAGIRFVMHVIGFDVTEEEKAQLECMAQAGGGEYFMAKTAKDFQAAAKEVVKKAQVQEFGVLKMVTLKNGKPLHAWVEIHEAGTEKVLRTETTAGETGVREIKLPPGRYDVFVKDSQSVSGGERPPVRFSDVSIELGQTVERRADFSDGTLVIKAMKNDKPVQAGVLYYRHGETESFFNEATHPKTGEVRRKLVPGTYDIRVVDSSTAGNPSIDIRGIEVPPGGSVEKTVKFASGTLKMITTQNGEPVPCPVKVFSPDGRVASDFWTQKGQRTVQLPQGTYDVEVTLLDIPGGNPVIRSPGVIIEPDRTEERTVDFEIGFLKVTATLNGAPFSTPVKLYKDGSRSNIGHWTSGGARTFLLVPGVYHAKVVNIKDETQFKSVEGIEIQSGKTVNIDAAFPVSPQETKTPAAPPSPPEAAPAPKAGGDETAPSGPEQPTGGADAVMNGELPLMEGTRVLKEMTVGAGGRVDLETPATPEEVLNFYKQAMTAKGWQPGMAMVQGKVGVLQMKDGGRQLMIKAEGQGDVSKVSIALVGQ